MAVIIIKKPKAYCRLMRLHKPIGIILLFWPMMWALWIAANGTPPIKELLIFTLGTIMMRSAGCVINDIADRKIDLHVERTKERPLTTGEVSLKEALVLFIILTLLSFLLVLLLNKMTIAMSFIAIALASIYPFCKRFTYLPQLFLGLAFGWAVPMAFTAILNKLPFIAWLLYLATIIITICYDTMYAMVDRDDDLKIGVKSTAILFNRYDKIIIAVLQIIFIALMIIIGAMMDMNIGYYSFLSAAALLFIYQGYLIKDRDKKNCFRAFLNNHWTGMLIFSGIFLELY
ncbi:MAG: 4-hydroxybenzoate octaprenyltransferase [Gammaproteobacteria bacterium]|nr:MAG: 4-hydroxybenzoate octaprenyltransferase [Gammaproteobacteria bacterium]